MRPAPPSLILLLAASSVASASGCAQILGVEDFSDQPAGGGAVGVAGGASGGAAGVGGTGQGGQGAATGTEDCLDRVDNNGDGFSDCEDPQCEATHGCTPAAPLGWSGVGWIHQTDPAADCPAPHWTGLFDEAGLTAPAASCACSCGAPDARCKASASCSSSCHGAPFVSGWAFQSCQGYDTTSGPLDCWAESLTVEATSCAAAPVLTAPPAVWQPAGSACLPAQAGHCPSAAEVCAPKPPAGARGPCVAQAGDAACPPSFPVAVAGFWDGTIDDGRSCTPGSCGCGSPSGMACTCGPGVCGVEVHTAFTCSMVSPPIAVIDSLSCVRKNAQSPAPDGTVAFSLVGASVTTAGSCAPSGATAATGDVQAARPIAVCCVD